MFDLDKLISEAYDGEAMSFEKLAEMVEDMMVLQESLGILSEDTGPAAATTVTQPEAAPSDITITYKGLPQINISELGWANPDGDPAEIGMRNARERMEVLLGKFIEKDKDYPESLKGTLESLASAFPREFDETNLKKVLDNSQTSDTDTQSALGYIVAYKTLTEIVRNFGASPAGFVFESFISILLGGAQVPTGQQTIADLLTADGTPVSLKLLSGGYIKGSYRDLINDLARDESTYDNIHYLVCIKRTGGSGLNTNGRVDFHNFKINKENLRNLFAAGGTKKAQNYMRMPKKDDKVFIPPGVLSTPTPAAIQEVETREIPPERATKFSLFMGSPPPADGSAAPQQEQEPKSRLELARDAFVKDFNATADNYFTALGVAKPTNFKDLLFKKLEALRFSQPPVKDVESLFDYFIDSSDFLTDRELKRTFTTRLAAYLNLALRNVLIDQLKEPEQKENKKLAAELFNHTQASYSAANLRLWKYRTKLSVSRSAVKTSKEAMASLLTSIVKQFNNAVMPSVEAYVKNAPQPAGTFDFDEWATFEESKAYLETLPDDVSRMKALRVSYGFITEGNWAFSLNQMKEGTGGGEDSYLGALYVGVNNVLKLAESFRGHFDTKIVEIFQQLNVLTQSLEELYASGLNNDPAITKTEESAEVIKDEVGTFREIQNQDDEIYSE